MVRSRRRKGSVDLFYLYLSGLIVGGIAVAASLFGGDGEGLGDGMRALAILRLRLFFFFAFFFGLAGLIGGVLMESGTALLTALGAGVLCAILGDWSLSRLSGSSTDSSLAGDDLIGLEAEVTVPIATGSTGKISATVQGRTIELLVRRADAQGPLNPGDKVLVLEIDDGVAVVDAI